MSNVMFGENMLDERGRGNVRRLVAAMTVLAALAVPTEAAHGQRGLLASDDFRRGTGKWRAELEKGGTVTARGGRLDIDVPGGATVWLRQRLSGPVEIRFTATAVSEGGPNDHVTDLNVFWQARDARDSVRLFAVPRSGAFAEYDWLRTYYVGFGGNLNTTTRMRRYVGTPDVRPLLFDRAGPLLVANRPMRIRLVADGRRIQYWVDDRVLFDYDDPSPYRSGWFAFRTVASHLRITEFSVRRLVGRAAPR